MALIFSSSTTTRLLNFLPAFQSSLLLYSFSTFSPMASSKQVHEVAAEGFNNSEAMEKYTRARPGYPVDSVECLLNKGLEGVVSSSPDKKTFKILDLASGTGKLTVPVHKALSTSPSFSNFEFEIHAVEPAEAMRVEWDKVMAPLTSTNVTTKKAKEGTSHNIPYSEGFFDVVLIGQAFHWFCNEPSMEEMSRVLCKDGGVGMIWNLESRSSEWLWELRKMYQQYDEGLPQYHRMEWKKFLEERKPVGLQCPPLLSEEFHHEIIMSPDLLWDRILSKSYIAVLTEEEKAALKERVDKHLEKCYPDVGRDETSIPVPHDTKVVWMKKI